MSAQHVLFVVGAFLEFGGIAAVAFPDLVPYGNRVSLWIRKHAARLRNWLRPHAHRVANVLRRLIGRPPVPIFRDLSAAVEASAGVGSRSRGASKARPLE
jgi:hypothetical protein